MKNTDYAKLEARMLASLPQATQTIFELAHKEINAATTPFERNLAKMKFFSVLYGIKPEDLEKIGRTTGKIK